MPLELDRNVVFCVCFFESVKTWAIFMSIHEGLLTSLPELVIGRRQLAVVLRRERFHSKFEKGHGIRFSWKENGHNYVFACGGSAWKVFYCSVVTHWSCKHGHRARANKQAPVSSANTANCSVSLDRSLSFSLSLHIKRQRQSYIQTTLHHIAGAAKLVWY